MSLPCVKGVKFQSAAYDQNGSSSEYGNNLTGAIIVKASGETVVTFVDNNIDTARRDGADWEKVTITPTSEAALGTAALSLGETYSFVNGTNISQSIALPSGMKYDYVNYKADGTVANMYVDRTGAVSVSAKTTTVLTIREGSGTIYLPSRSSNSVTVMSGGAGIVVKTLSAGSRHTATNNSNVEIKLTLKYKYDANTYQAKYYDNRGVLNSEIEVKGKDLKILAGGKTEFTVGKNDLTFYYPSGLNVILD